MTRLHARPPTRTHAHREKDTRRALIQQERLVLRQRHREGAAVPPDDEELEYRALLEAAGIDPATIALDPEEDAAQAAAQAAADQALADAGVPVPAATPPPRKRPRPDLPRPPFPPPSLELHPAWPAPERQPPAASTAAAGAAAAAENGGDAEMADAEAQPQPPEATPAPEGAQPQLQSDAQPEAEAEEELSDSLDPDLGTELLVCWSFLQSFADLFGVAVPSLEQLLGGLAAGEDSRLLGDVHCALLRLLQADMEDAHDEKERVGVSAAGPLGGGVGVEVGVGGGARWEVRGRREQVRSGWLAWEGKDGRVRRGMPHLPCRRSRERASCTHAAHLS